MSCISLVIMVYECNRYCILCLTLTSASNSRCILTCCIIGTNFKMGHVRERLLAASGDYLMEVLQVE